MACQMWVVNLLGRETVEIVAGRLLAITAADEAGGEPRALSLGQLQCKAAALAEAGEADCAEHEALFLQSVDAHPSRAAVNARSVNDEASTPIIFNLLALMRLPDG